MMLELPKIWFRPQSEVVGRVVEVSGWDLVENARRSGRGILFLTPHLGCFDITGQYLVGHPDRAGDFHPLTALYRSSRQKWLEPVIKHGRGAHFTLASADIGGVRKLLKALKSGEAVVVLPDQAPSAGEGVWVPFFGQPAYTMTLAARLAQTGATVLLMYAERLAYGTGYRLYFVTPEAEVGTPEDINREIERLVRRCPSQYLWGYNRYKAPAGASAP
jgi:KDO2-lipid IV(A) lauroyltransferase